MPFFSAEATGRKNSLADGTKESKKKNDISSGRGNNWQQC